MSGKDVAGYTAAGTTTGAAAGAAVGSVVPIVGTAIGGAVGGALGAIGGLFGGLLGGKKKKNRADDLAALVGGAPVAEPEPAGLPVPLLLAGAAVLAVALSD